MSDSNFKSSPEDIIVGGQAVIEGVMMRTPYASAIAVRRMDGSMEVQKKPVKRVSEYWKPLSWYVVRGFAVLLQSMVLGMKALNFSINVAMKDEEEAQEKKKPGKAKKKGSTYPVAFSMIVAAAFAIGLFILVPLWLTSLFAFESWIVFNLVDGLIRVIFFLGYIILVSRLKDIQRVFQYHGAEHKVVHTWEAGEDLTVENARKKSPQHPRCGTSFLMFVMVVSIIVFSLVKFEAFWAIFLSRLVLVPIISGLSYELIRLSAPRCEKGFFRLIVMPGIWLQYITTKEPSDDQLEVAIHALEEALELDSIRAREAQTAA